MNKDEAKSCQDFPQAEVEQRDSQSIADLIQMLDRDRAEAQQPSSKPR